MRSAVPPTALPWPGIGGAGQGDLRAVGPRLARIPKKHRWRSAVDVYEGICRREKQLGLVPGVELFTTYEQLAGLGEVHKTTVGKALRRLAALGLITFVLGSGSGRTPRDRVASRVGRVVPIPTPPGSPYTRNRRRWREATLYR